MKEIKQIDFFCGGGGFGTAAKQAGIKIVQAFDWDTYAVKMYNHNVGNHAQKMDITQTKWSDLKTADIWSFGFPCTDLSRARTDERKKLEGENSKTFYEIMRLLDELKEHNPDALPSILLVENVYELAEVMDVLDEEFLKRGYTINPGLYNAKYWGVPQTRERWFVVGVRNDIEQDYPIVKQVIREPVKLKYFLDDEIDEKYIYNPDKYPYEFYKTPERPTIGLWEVAKFQTKWLDIMKRVYSSEGILPTLHTSQGGHRHAKIYDVDRKVVRRPTPREYARGQGFPEDYDIIVSDTQAYKIFGNAVAVPLAKAHLDNIKSFLLSL